MGRPQSVLEERRLRVADGARRARVAVERRSERLGARIGAAEASLRALDPNQVLERGYALVWRHEDQRLVRSVAQVQPEDGIFVSVADGTIDARVTGTETEHPDV